MTHIGPQKIFGATALLLASTSIASADISRTDPSVRLLFEETGATGNYVELSFGFVNPDANSGGVVPDPLDSYVLPNFGFLHRYNDQISVAVQYDTPFGADVGYPGFGSATGAPFFGGFAEVDTRQLTIMGRYEFGNGFSVHGGLRALEVEGSIYTNVAGLTFNRLDGTSDIGYGYLIGAAYEVPDIALRVALTYFSELEVDFNNASEDTVVPTTGVVIATGTADNFSVEFPESITLEFQTGVAPGTLVFGSIHHEYWDGFNLTTGVGSYVNFTEDSTTYEIGVGRQFTENFSGSVSYTHRTDGAIPSDSSLTPTTGLNTLTLAGQYTMDQVTVSGGITYGRPGDQIVNAASTVNFEDNEVFGIGLRIGFRF